MTREQAEKELIAMLEEAGQGPYYDADEVFAHLLESLTDKFALTEEERRSYEQRMLHETEVIQALGLLEE
ncbi:hypothetical protein SAMN02745823_00320 [Sporobacter termitidis DSM 10068]|uniref:Uncharacterized protein n=1 Tax=Sporobacter termitidis DSM 10068 TaxID=1123282 RepID=A0A1M5U1N1_9FIRM|nr:hypothetical protein [Sporobacter termitidis]SHH56878.1 hypothetical protein SAMN02745823_00320 [Sporobacter termitidis DSM 10068]